MKMSKSVLKCRARPTKLLLPMFIHLLNGKPFFHCVIRRRYQIFEEQKKQLQEQMILAMSFFGRNSYSLKGYWVLGDRSASNFLQLFTLHFLKESFRKERKALFALRWVHKIYYLHQPKKAYILKISTQVPNKNS